MLFFFLTCGRTIHSHKSLEPPSHAGYHPGHTLLWDGIPFFNQHLLQVSQSGCVGHSGMNSSPKLILDCRNMGLPLVAKNLQNFWIPLCIEIASNNNKSWFLLPHLITLLSTNKCYSISTAVITLWPYYPSESGLIVKHNVPSHAQDNQVPDY